MKDQCPCGAKQIDGEITEGKCRLACPQCGRHTAWCKDMMEALSAWRKGKTKTGEGT